MWKKLPLAASAIVLCAATNGCIVASSGEVQGSSSAVGTLTTDWTLDGSSDADVCAFYRVDRVNVVLVDDAGFVVADEEPFCEDFGISFEVSTGWYSSEVTLLDVQGYAVSDTVVVDVRVMRDTEVFVDVDFPDGAID